LNLGYINPLRLRRIEEIVSNESAYFALFLLAHFNNVGFVFEHLVLHVFLSEIENLIKPGRVNGRESYSSLVFVKALLKF